MSRQGSRRRVRQRQPRTLLKIRAVPLVRMPRSTFFYKIRDACKTGIVPDDIEMRTLQWDHKDPKGKVYRAGQKLDAADAKELQNCYALMRGVSKQDVRFERPDA